MARFSSRQVTKWICDAVTVASLVMGDGAKFLKKRRKEQNNTRKEDRVTKTNPPDDYPRKHTLPRPCPPLHDGGKRGPTVGITGKPNFAPPHGKNTHHALRARSHPSASADPGRPAPVTQGEQQQHHGQTPWSSILQSKQGQ